MPSAAPDPVDPAVAKYFADRPAHLAMLIARLRSLVFDVAAGSPGVGALSETLKWGEPSYAPEKPRVGSSVEAALRHCVAMALTYHLAKPRS